MKRKPFNLDAWATKLAGKWERGTCNDVQLIKRAFRMGQRHPKVRGRAQRKVKP